MGSSLKRYSAIGLLLLIILCLSACGMNQTQGYSKQKVSNKNKVLNKSSDKKNNKHKIHTVSKQKQKEEILSWENRTFNQLDDYSSIWQNMLNGNNLWGTFNAANIMQYGSKAAENKLDSVKEKLKNKQNDIEKIVPPTSVPKNIEMKLIMAQSHLINSLNDSQDEIYQLINYGTDMKAMQGMHLKDLRNDATKMNKEQREFERGINAVNALYGIPPTHYFDKANN